MSKIETFHVGQRYFVGEVIVDDCDVYSQTDCYTTLGEAMADLECLAQECEADIDRKDERLIEPMVRQYEVKSLDDDGNLGVSESVGPGVALPEESMFEAEDEPSLESLLPPAGERRYTFDAEKSEGTIEIETATGTAQVTAKLLVEGDDYGDWFITAMYVGHESFGGEPTDFEIAYALRAIETNDLGVGGDC